MALPKPRPEGGKKEASGCERGSDPLFQVLEFLPIIEYRRELSLMRVRIEEVLGFLSALHSPLHPTPQKYAITSMVKIYKNIFQRRGHYGLY